MKMRQVIGAARDASPLMNDQLASVRQLLEHFGELLVDLGRVQSEAGRQSMVDICSQGLVNVRTALDKLNTTWQDFDSVLKGYKRRFRSKKNASKDAPGQMTFYSEDSCAPGPGPGPGSLPGMGVILKDPDDVPVFDRRLAPEVEPLKDADDPGHFDSSIVISL